MTSWCPDAPAEGGNPRLHKPVPVIVPYVPESGMGPIARMILEQAQYDAEMKLRTHRRALAGRMGTCAGCGTEDQVIGLPGSEYCRYCEELRVLGPQEPAQPPPPQRHDIPQGARAVLGLACLAVALGMIFTGAAGIFTPGLFIVWGLMLLRRL